MRRSALGCLLVLGSLLVVSALQAQPARVFISRDGSDANPCFDAANPCRSTQRGVDTVAPREARSSCCLPGALGRRPSRRP